MQGDVESLRVIMNVWACVRTGCGLYARLSEAFLVGVVGRVSYIHVTSAHVVGTRDRVQLHALRALFTGVATKTGVEVHLEEG